MEENFPSPDVKAPPHSLHSILGETTRYVKIVDLIRGALESQKAQSELNFTDLKGVEAVFGIDNAKVTKSESMEAGFLGLQNFHKRRHSPGGLMIFYLGRHGEDHMTLNKAGELSFKGLTDTISWKCPGKQVCAYCRDKCITQNYKEHKEKLTCWAVSDLKATMGLLNVESQTCFRCLKKVGVRQTVTGDTASEKGATKTMEYYMSVNKGWEQLRLQWEKDRDTMKFEDSKFFAEFLKQHTGHKGPCALTMIKDLNQIRICALHLLLQLGNMMFDSIKNQAVFLELNHYNGIVRISNAAIKAGIPWFAAKVIARWAEQKKKVGMVAHDASTSLIKKLSNEEVVVEYQKKCTTMAHRKRDCIFICSKLYNQTWEQYVEKHGIVGKLNKDDIGYHHRNLLLVALEQENVSRADLLHSNDITKSRDSNDEYNDLVVNENDVIDRVKLDEDKLKLILMNKINLMGRDVLILLNGGFEPLCRAISKKRAKSAVRIEKRKQKLEEKLTAIGLRLFSLEKEQESAEEEVEIESLEREKDLIEEELANCISDLDMDIGIKGHDDDQTYNNLVEEWKLFSVWMLPLMEGNMEALSDGKLQKMVNRWWTKRQTNGKAECKSLYVHYCLHHLQDDVDWLLKNHSGKSMASFSTQRSEHGNKIVKGLLKNLYGFMNGTKYGNKFTTFELIIREHALRVWHFMSTVPKNRNQSKCSECGGNHNRNNKTCPSNRD
eukprot:m.343169 g.343169  ORF g.343169 m.343169 type:complete len:721 (-) comp22439_c0_seq1:46-2208(-)